jgi:hypothetical protein
MLIAIHEHRPARPAPGASTRGRRLSIRREKMENETPYQVGNEMESLNLDELDLEGLERRLELAAMMAPPGDCTVHCGTNCTGDIGWRC